MSILHIIVMKNCYLVILIILKCYKIVKYILYICRTIERKYIEYNNLKQEQGDHNTTGGHNDFFFF